MPYGPSRCEEAIPGGCLCAARGPLGPVADFGGMALAFAGAPGAPVFRRSSACTSMPV